jgi:hypothetical protein
MQVQLVQDLSTEERETSSPGMQRNERACVLASTLWLSLDDYVFEYRSVTSALLN